MGSLAGEAVRLPPVVFDLTNRLGVGFARTADFHRFLGMLFIVAWLGLCLLLFGLGSHSQRGRLTSLGFLLMAAGLFHVQLPFAGWMAGIPVGRWTSAILAGAGAGALLLLLLSQHRTQLNRWELGIASAVAVGVLLWQGTGLSRLFTGQPAVEWTLWAAALLVVGGSAAIAILRGWRSGLTRSVAPAWALAVLAFLSIWAATLLFPAWNIRGVVHPFAPLGVTLYLLPWLVPLGGTIAAARCGLWAKG